MPSFKVKVNTPAWLKQVRDKQRPVATAAVEALRETAANIVQEGRRNIGAAGPGFRQAQWQSGLQYRTKGATAGGEPSLRARATIYHRYGIFGVFEFGPTTIHAKGGRLMWIPTTHGAPTASKSGKTLTSATVRGKPMLFDANDKSRDRKPLYIGVPSVTIPDKFDVTEIAEENVAKIGELFIKHFKDN